MMKHAICVKAKLLHPKATMPHRATIGSAALDLSYAGDEQFYLQPFARKLVPTGVALEIPNGYEGQIRPRSGLALERGVTVLNSPGTIDSDYRGEIKVLLIQFGHTVFYIEPGDRIAQLVVAPIPETSLFCVDVLGETERGEGGYGSTGVKQCCPEFVRIDAEER